MKGITVAIIGDNNIGAELAKKGTESDIRFFNLKRSEISITYVAPFRYPEKIQSLMHALMMADAVLLVVEAIDKVLGEEIIAIESSGIKHGYIVLKNYIQPDQLKPFIKGTVLEKYAIVEPDINKINDFFINLEIMNIDGPVLVPVDHFYNVKGVGVVILGVVKRGVLNQHEELEVYPTGKKALIRSIQVHDEDVKLANFGERVGAALKGINIEDIERGCIIAPAGTLKLYESGTLELYPSKYWKGDIHTDKVIYLSVGMQIRSARVTSKDAVKPGQKSLLSVKFEKPLACNDGERLVAIDIDAKDLRIIGYGVMKDGILSTILENHVRT
jgi:selenocysteine-specific translation elongation factor